MDSDPREQALERIANGRPIEWIGRALRRIDGVRVHVRFCGTDPNRPKHFKFGINAASLSADEELWVCGDQGDFFLVPVSSVRAIYSDPAGYIDGHHPRIRVLSVDIRRLLSKYARGKNALDLRPYHGRTITSRAA